MPAILLFLSILFPALAQLASSLLRKENFSLRLFLRPDFWRTVAFVFLFTVLSVMLCATDFLAPLHFTRTSLLVALAASFTGTALLFLRRLHMLLSAESRRIPVALVALLLLAVFAEVFVFNFRAFESREYQAVDLTDRISATNVEDDLDEDGFYVMLAVGKTLFLYVHDLNMPVCNIYIELEAYCEEKAIGSFTVIPHVTDDGNALGFVCPSKAVLTSVETTHYIPMNLSGNCGELRLEIPLEADRVAVHRIAVNQPRPLAVSVLRLLAVFVLLSFAYLLRRKSPLWRLTLAPFDLTRFLLTAATALGFVFVCTFLVLGRPGFGTLLASHQAQYQELADAFLNGHLHLFQHTPPDFLLQMDNPYDTWLRQSLELETGEFVYWDAAFFDGKYFVYFGVLPCLLLFLPFRALTGLNLSNDIAVLFFAMVLVFALFFLVYEMLRRFCRPERVSLLAYLLLCSVCLVGGGLFYMVRSPDLYTIPIAAGLAFATLGLALWMRAARDPGHLRPLPLFFGSLSMAAVTACRPQLFLLVLLAFPIFRQAILRDRSLFSRRHWKNSLLALLPFFLVALPLMWYNAARFGSPFDFGANYNLTTNDMTLRGFRIERVGLAVWHYLLQLPKFISVYPFIRECDLDTLYRGITIFEPTYGGIFIVCPFLWFLFSVRKNKELLHRHNATPYAALFLLIGIALALFDAQGAGILQRYFLDFSLPLLLAAVVAYAVREDHFRGPAKDSLHAMLAAAFAASFAYQFCLMLTEGTSHAYLIQFWD